MGLKNIRRINKKEVRIKNEIAKQKKTIIKKNEIWRSCQKYFYVEA